MQPYGALTLFFRWRKKSVQKKASGTATTGKSPLLPILTAGLAMSRAAWLASLRLPSCALGARLFPPSKWRAFFPPLPIAALLRRSRRGAYAPLAGWDASVWIGRFCGVNEWADSLIHSWRGAYLPRAGWDASVWVGRFYGADESADFLSCSRRRASLPFSGWDASVWHKYFCIATGQREFDFTLAFLSEP